MVTPGPVDCHLGTKWWQYGDLIYTSSISTDLDGFRWIFSTFALAWRLAQADTSGEGRMSFTEFLALARDLEDGVRKEKSRKESLLGELWHDTIQWYL